MSASFYPQNIDVIGALESAGIQYQRSGSWVRCKAVWRDSREKDVAIHADNGGWIDHGGLHEHGAWPALCERLGIYCPTPTRQTWTEEERKEYGRQQAARRAAQEQKEAKSVSERMAIAANHWNRWSKPLLDEKDPNAIAMRDYIQYRGLKPETLAQVARVGRSNQRPCLIYGRRDPHTGAITTIHREWARRTWPKENGANKRGLGPSKFAGESVYALFNEHRIGQGTLALSAEGQLTSGGGAEIFPDAPVLCWFTSDGLQNPARKIFLDLWAAGVREFGILADSGKAGIDAGHMHARKILLTLPQAKVWISAPPEGRVPGQKKGEDWLDVRVGYEGVAGLGDEATRALIAQCAVPPRCQMESRDPEATKNDAKKVAFLSRWEKTSRAPGIARLTVKQAEIANRHAIREQFFSTPPSILAGDMGLGKTTEAAKFIALLWRLKSAPYSSLSLKERRIMARLERSGKLKNVPPVLFLMPTLELARALVAMIEDLVKVKGVVGLHKGRDEDNCFQIVKIEALMNRGRAPNPQACLSCDHGLPDNKRSDKVKPCSYMMNLRFSVYTPIVVAVHAAGAEDSLLYQYETSMDLMDSDTIPRKLIVDESPAAFTPGIVPDEKHPGAQRGNIQSDDLREWRSLGDAALADLYRMMGNDIGAQEVSAINKKVLQTRLKIRKDARILAKAKARDAADLRLQRAALADLRKDLRDLKKQKTAAGRSEEGKSLIAWREAISWTRRILVWLKKLDDARHESPIDETSHPIDSKDWMGLAALCKDVPERAKHLDATLLERVVWSKNSQAHQIPLRGIETLGEALADGTASFYKGGIIAIVQASLSKQIIKRGAILMDGTPALQKIDEVKAMGGKVYTIRAATPEGCVSETNLIMGQMRGRGGLGDPKVLGARVADVKTWMNGGAKVITHKPVFTDLVQEAIKRGGPGLDKEMIKDIVAEVKTQVRNWGDHTSFNDWKHATRGVMDGVNIPSPLQQTIEYQAYRAALAKIGIQKEFWDGSQTRGQDVRGDGFNYHKSNAWLPSVGDAREWLHDKIEGQIAQGLARLRALRPNGRTHIRCDIHTNFPIAGRHGIEITDVKLTPKGRATQTLKTESTIAEAIREIEDEEEYASYRKIRVGVYAKIGIMVSMSTIRKVKDAIEKEALVAGCTEDEALDGLVERAKTWLGHAHGDSYKAARRQAEVCPTDTGVATILVALADAQGAQPRRAQAP